MSDIAATVGINRPTLHYYFRTKDKMFKAVFGSIVISLMPKIHDIIKLTSRLSTAWAWFWMSISSFLPKNPISINSYAEKYSCDVNHLLEVAKELQFEATLSLVKDTLLAEMEAGKIKKVPLPMVFLTFLQPADLSFSCKESDNDFVSG